jgi:hypothetical protein
MMHCKEATRLMSQEHDRELNTKERLALTFHTLICDACTNYRKHLHFISNAARRYREGRISNDE